MFFKKNIIKKVYSMYLQNFTISYIAHELGMSEDDVNEIIDYINELYV